MVALSVSVGPYRGCSSPDGVPMCVCPRDDIGSNGVAKIDKPGIPTVPAPLAGLNGGYLDRD